MASLRKRARSPYYFACFTGPDGRRLQRSTKQVKRREAQAVANEWDKAARLGVQKRFGEAQARRVIADIYETINAEPLRSAVAREFLTQWAEKRKVDTAARTYQAYAQVARDFIKSLGERASLDISQINKADVSKFRDEVLCRASVANANKTLKYLRVALGAAYKDGVAQENPAAKLDTFRRRETDRAERRPFTVKELTNILANASGEWKGIILFGLYTGQRLKDIARLRARPSAAITPTSRTRQNGPRSTSCRNRLDSAAIESAALWMKITQKVGDFQPPDRRAPRNRLLFFPPKSPV